MKRKTFIRFLPIRETVLILCSVCAIIVHISLEVAIAYTKQEDFKGFFKEMELGKRA